MAIVTYEAVAAAAEALQAAGQRPSVRAVTAAIGGGSPNTVLKMLADWKAGRPVVRVADTELDPKITSAIAEQMQRVATAAAAAAAVYAARKGIRTGLLAERFGGQVMDTLAIENFISVKETDGPKLVAGLEEHVKDYDVDIMNLQRATQLKAGRLWQKQLLTLRYPDMPDEVPPIFASQWKLTSKAESNDKGGWYGWDINLDRLLDPGTDQALLEDSFKLFREEQAKLGSSAPAEALTAGSSSRPAKDDGDVPF